MSSAADSQIAGAARPAATGWFGSWRSVFVKLVIVMVSMAVSLLVLVGFFFWYLVGPNLHREVDSLLEDYTANRASRSPDLATAQELSRRLNLQVRYEGPAGRWATDDTLPGIDDVRSGRVRKSSVVLLARNYFVAPAPDGGTYLFAWSLGDRMASVHTALIVLLLCIMVAVVVITHIVLRRLLAPLRTLNEGVDRLSAGQLDVLLPNPTRDEFGRLTAAFNTMVERVRAMLQARDQLLIDVSHELRSPLTRLKVALELLPETPPRAGMSADVAEMGTMVATLLELERLRSGAGLEISRCDLLALIKDAAEPFVDARPGIRLDAPLRPVPLDLDAEKIKSVFRNLLDNAAKYAPPGSQPVAITVAEEGDSIRVCVADDGPGIADHDAERIFEPFYRSDRSRSKATGGYGLGLSICKRVMQAHGGDIMLERGGAARGATFVLWFRR